jgi:hypothetical protein
MTAASPLNWTQLGPFWISEGGRYVILHSVLPELGDTNRATEHVYYIQCGPAPNDVCRWTDCEFLALPIAPWGQLP